MPAHFPLLLLTLLWTVLPAHVAGAGERQLPGDVLWRHHAVETSCEIVAYDPSQFRLFVTVGKSIEVLAAKTGQRVAAIAELPGYHATSVAVSRGRVAVAWAAEDKSQRGRVGCYDAETLQPIVSFEAGYHPDMVTFSPNGRYLLAANEGEPTDDYTVDREGSITIVDTLSGLKHAKRTLVDFSLFNAQREELRREGVRIFGPSLKHTDQRATVAEDLEPEYIAVSEDSRKAWVTLQENNAIAELDLERGEVTAIYALGTKDFSALAGQKSPWRTTGLDVTDTDGGTHVRHWPVVGLFQPDGVAEFDHRDEKYLVTANEGDPRDYPGYQELCPLNQLASRGYHVAPQVAGRFLASEDQLGQLEISTACCTAKDPTCIDHLECFGARSFSIWKIEPNHQLRLIYDSGNDFESIAAHEAVERFHANRELGQNPDCRSCKRGPEPESVVIGQVGQTRLAMISLERTGGVMVYDLTVPIQPKFLQYLPPHLEDGLLDCGPEGLVFIDAAHSPTLSPLVILCNEVSGTTTAYEL